MRPVVTNGVAPSSSSERAMRADESPEPDLKARHLFTSAAPTSEADSDEDPALGNVMEIVEDEDAFSETTVSPLGSLVTEAVLAADGAGEVRGMLGNSSKVDTRAENSLFAAILAREGAADTTRRMYAIVLVAKRET
mmetsp:Transcript_6039/g.8790  ORF Transcript_6039/g.8790 Transcript_6039/m.8790 type:complete len:137 (-) Transcript_6039:54-464(-)